MAGQVNRGSHFGEHIYKFSLYPEFKNYVEVGTWNGEGSTKCFMDALFGRFDDSCLYTVEANIEFYDQASKYWDTHTMLYRGPYDKLHLLYGRLIEVEDLVSEEEVRAHPIFPQHPWLEWRNRNIKEYGECENIAAKLPDEIDVLLLDGGQFSTRGEFDLLKDRSKVVMLDDTNTFKTEKIRQEILENPDTWSILVDLPGDRHGFTIACKKEWSDRLRNL